LASDFMFVEFSECDLVQKRLKSLSGRHTQQMKLHRNINLRFESNFEKDLNLLQTHTDAHASSEGGGGAPSSSSVHTHKAAQGSDAQANAHGGSYAHGAAHTHTSAAIPPTKLHVLYMLRFLRLRKLKDEVFSRLNFFRSVEKRLVTDDAGYSFEDKHQFTPHTHADAHAEGDASTSETALPEWKPVHQSVPSALHGLYPEPSSSPAEPSARPAMHSASYFPSDYESQDSTFMAFEGVEDRDDHYTLTADNDVCVWDPRGVRVVYDVVVDDMDLVETELLRLGKCRV
jgi:hypothetical protein